VSTLAHVFEAEGIATVALGSIRKQIEGSAPPRGLWCDFPLGRPLGKPGDPEFQHRVLDVAFALLDATEPVLTEFDESIPDDGDEMIVCPLPPRHDPDAHPAIDEARGLLAAYGRGVEMSVTTSAATTRPLPSRWSTTPLPPGLVRAGSSTRPKLAR